MGAREDLRAEADAEHRLVGFPERARERRLARQVGMVDVVERILRAAEHDQRVDSRQADAGRLVAEMRAQDAALRARLGERRCRPAQASSSDNSR